MTGSIIPGAIDAIIATLNAGAPSFTVIDGPGATDAAISTAVFIGLNTTDSTDFIEAASTDQVWAWLGHDVRDETAYVHCLAEAWDGGSVMKVVRDQVFAIMTAVTDMLQSNANLTGTVLYVVGVRGGSYAQTQDAKGVLAQIRFDIQLRGRLS